ncbi:MAG: GTP-binding protein [Calditrichia bacterium]
MSEKPNVDSTRQFVIGTAGHIDHGKTALVKALSGVDTDRLPEEKKRGITIDLGFAHLTDNITFIDVPGHERFIKNMVAGVSSIYLVLFVIAADDGVMPQTREHFDIINLLHIRHGIFVITKTDLADDDWLMLVEDDIRQLLSGTAFADSPILQTSVAKNVGIDELRTKILETLATIPARADSEIFRQPVDRVFFRERLWFGDHRNRNWRAAKAGRRAGNSADRTENPGARYAKPRCGCVVCAHRRSRSSESWRMWNRTKSSEGWCLHKLMFSAGYADERIAENAG